MNGKQLKNSILQWAIQGKLVPQDPNDEPASVLLERIRAEKERLIKEKKIKRSKNESIIYRGEDNSYYEKFEDGTVKCIDDEIPFEIPNGWEWERWGNVSYSIQYGYNAPAKPAGDILMVRISDIQNNQVVWDGVPYCDIEEKEILSYLLRDNDILFARTGGTVGKSFLVKQVPERAIYAGYLIRTQYDTSNLCPEYLKAFMESQLYWNQLKKGTIATAQPNCNGQTLGGMLLPIPPFSEQNHITEKLAVLAPVLQKYSVSQDSLDYLNNELNNKLKKAILQDAIQGKLVPQDPNDEPASVLLERIRAEKERLIKEKKIKRSKNESIIYRGEDNSYYEKFEDGSVKCIDDEIPFEIPKGWEWCRLSTVCSYLHRGKSPKYGMVKEFPIIAQKCNQWDKLYIDRCQYSDIDFIAKYSDDQFVQLHDILINSTGGGTVGRTGFVDNSIFELYSRFVADSHVTVVRPFASVSPRYVYFYLISPYIQVGLEDRCSGSTNQIELGTSTIGNYLLPLPPYKEQERIISIVNDILPKVIIYGNSQDKLNSLNQQIRLSLKKSILQEAIQGRLVPQDPTNDEPASVLLERIRAEKERLIKEKKIKRDKNESVIYKDDDNSYYEKFTDGIVKCIDEEIPFRRPKSWSWCRMKAVCQYLHRGKSPNYGLIKELPIIAQKCNHWDKLYIDRCQFSDIDSIEKYSAAQFLQAYYSL